MQQLATPESLEDELCGFLFGLRRAVKALEGKPSSFFSSRRARNELADLASAAVTILDLRPPPCRLSTLRAEVRSEIAGVRRKVRQTQLIRLALGETLRHFAIDRGRLTDAHGRDLRLADEMFRRVLDNLIKRRNELTQRRYPQPDLTKRNLLTLKRLNQILWVDRMLPPRDDCPLDCQVGRGQLAQLVTVVRNEGLGWIANTLDEVSDTVLSNPSLFSESDPAARATIFISYSHRDEAWKDRLVDHLKVLEHEQRFEVWDDRRLSAGSEWFGSIEAALNRATVAVLLISVSFLTSEFIRQEEVPRLLRRRDGGLLLVPVVVRPCAWQKVAWLAPIQCRPTDGRALSSMTDDEADQHLARLAIELDRLLIPGP